MTWETSCEFVIRTLDLIYWYWFCKNFFFFKFCKNRKKWKLDNRYFRHSSSPLPQRDRNVVGLYFKHSSLSFFLVGWWQQKSFLCVKQVRSSHHFHSNLLFHLCLILVKFRTQTEKTQDAWVLCVCVCVCASYVFLGWKSVGWSIKPCLAAPKPYMSGFLAVSTITIRKINNNNNKKE